jgi:SAM-dependent methyltransferase
MIEALWPGPPAAVVCADWTDVPLQASSRDVVLGDGGLHLLSYPVGQAALVTNLARALVPGGVVVMRLFVPPGPDGRETPESVLDDLLAGRIANLNLLKLRLGMALQPDAEAGVGVASVYEAVRQVRPDLVTLAATVGWDLDHLLAIESYRDSFTRYWFVTVDQVRDLFGASFDLEAAHVPSYELGERCPTVVLRRRAG